MAPDHLQELLEAVRDGRIPVTEALERITQRSVANLGYAQVDLDRRQRCGYPEVIFCEGKTPEWVTGVVQELLNAGQDCLATRVSPEQAERLSELFPAGQQDRLARTFWLPQQSDRQPQGRVLVITAGTSDLPVAREALVTAQALGAGVQLISDVGVAGIHRVLRYQADLANADVAVVVAGMDGALPSVVGGLAACPVIAVPTSIGYGAALGGIAPLLTMLNSCSANVAVVNIDSGFKAGYIAARIASRSDGAYAKSQCP